MKKFLAGLLSVCMAFTAIGCGGVGDRQVDNQDGIQAGTWNKPGDNKTTIKVAAMGAGLGRQWLINAAEEFARLNQETSFAPNKKGVYLELNQPDTGIAVLFTGMDKNNEDIVFTEQGYTVANGIAAGKYYPLTDVVTDETREGGTLESAMFDKYKEVFKKGDDYYAIPHAEYYGGLSYNHDVFLEHNALLADSTCNEDFVIPYEGRYNEGKPVYFVDSTSIGETGCVLSKGPDGKPNTEDDGMPCSIEEFLILLDYFTEEAKIAPIVLSGKYRNMLNYFICGMWASLAGQAQMESYYSLNGKIEVVTGFTNENLVDSINYVKKPITEWVDMTAKDAYLGNSMVAKYYALALAEIIQQEGYYLTKGVTGNTSHTDAQGILLNSSDSFVRSATGTPQTAMLMDATYWINETTFNGNYKTYNMYTLNEDKQPDVRSMALPTSVTTAEAEQKITDGKNAPSALMDINYGCCVANAKIKGNAEKEAAVKAFLKFFYSEEQLKNYTRSSHQFIALSYDFTEEELKELNPFYQRLWKLRDNENGSNIVYPSPRVGTDAQTMSTYKNAIATIYTALQTANLEPQDPSYTKSAYYVYDLNSNVKVGDIYLYGSQYVFNSLALTQQDWHSIYNVEM